MYVKPLSWVVGVLLAVSASRSLANNGDDLVTINPSYFSYTNPAWGAPFSAQFTVTEWSLASKNYDYVVQEFINKPWITSISPTLFTLGPNQGQVVTVSGMFPTVSDSATIMVELASGFTAGFITINVTHQTTGIEDHIDISGPTNITPGTTPSYIAQFHDAEPTGDFIIGPWSWVLTLEHQMGRHIYAEQSGSNWFLPNLSLDLPQDLEWRRNAIGDVIGDLVVSAVDTDGFPHSGKLDITLNLPPTKPRMIVDDLTATSLTLKYYANGAEAYTVHYGSIPGGPYNGTIAVEGSSPIDAGSSTIYGLSGFDFLKCGSYFAITATNANGSSVFSEISVGVPCPALSTWGILDLGLLIAIAGSVMISRR